MIHKIIKVGFHSSVFPQKIEWIFGFPSCFLHFNINFQVHWQLSTTTHLHVLSVLCDSLMDPHCIYQPLKLVTVFYDEWKNTFTCKFRSTTEAWTQFHRSVSSLLPERGFLVKNGLTSRYYWPPVSFTIAHTSYLHDILKCCLWTLHIAPSAPKILRYYVVIHTIISG